MEEERGLDRAAAIADMRFTFIRSLVDATVVKPGENTSAGEADLPKELIHHKGHPRHITGIYSVYELFGKAADLRFLYGGVLPGAGRPYYGGALPTLAI